MGLPVNLSLTTYLNNHLTKSIFCGIILESGDGMYRVTVTTNFEEMQINETKDFVTLPESISFAIEQMDKIDLMSSNERQAKFARFIKSYLRAGIRNIGYSVGRYNIGVDIISSKEEKKYQKDREKQVRSELKEEKKKLAKLKRAYKKLLK